MEQKNTPEAVAAEFPRIGETGRTVEFTTPNRPPEFLAYLDYNTERTMATVVVGYPYRGTQHSYSSRPADKARGIVARHLAGEGYAVPATIKQLD